MRKKPFSKKRDIHSLTKTKLLTNVSMVAALMAGSAANAQQSANTADDLSDFEEIVIVGSSIKTSAAELDMGSLNIELITDKDFKMTSGESIADFIQKNPVVGASASPTTDEYGGGRSTVNLRGIGAQYTLVLLNGRRFGGENVPDIGAIPTAAIENVQILKGGASAIYGSDAIAGVVNLKLKDDFEGVEVETSYGDTTKTDAASFKTTALFGYVDEGFSFVGSLGYQERGGILKEDRELTASRDYRDFGGLDRRSNFVGLPHQIFTSATSSISIDTSRVNIGENATSILDFVPYDRETQAVSTNESGTYPESHRYSAHWNLNYDLMGEKMTFFTNGYADRRHQEFIINRPIVDVLVPATNPYNPFGADIPVVYTFGENELGPMTEIFNTTAIQASTGVKGSLEKINYEIAYSYYVQTRNSTYMNDISTTAANEAVARTDATAFNPFGYWANSPEQLAGLSPTSTYQARNSVKTLSGKIDGDLFDWYAGTIKFAAGYEHRKVKDAFEPDLTWQTANYWWNGSRSARDPRERKVDAFHGELRVPVYKSDDGFVTEAEVSGAVRYEKYSDFGSSTVSQFSGRVSFLDDTLALRGSYAESFKAPSVAALNRPISTNTEPGGFFFDPVRNGFLPVDRIVGGNPDLDPEKGRTVNIGLVYRPDIGENDLLLKLDYWTLRLSERIGSPDGQALLNGTSTSGSITRDPITQYPTLDLRLDNGGVGNIEGIDVGIFYQMVTDNLGTFAFDFNATYLTKFEETGNNGVVVDFLGNYTNGTATPKLRAGMSTNWSKGNWGISNIIRYVDGYDEEIGSIAREVDNYITTDIQLSYTFDNEEGTLSGVQMYAGLENIFDADLPFVASSADGWDRQIADYRGRFFYVGARKRF